MSRKIFILTVFITFSHLLFADCAKDGNINFLDENIICLNEKKIEVEEDRINIYDCDDNDNYIMITSTRELYINNKLIKTDETTKKVIEEYYKLVLEIRKGAIQIALEGARLGIKGAQIGIVAVAKLPLLLLSDYDTDDYEKAIEKKAGRLEDDAKIIEKKGEELEALVDDLKYLEKKLRKKVEDINELNWF